ncbi:hypothetical protein GCM10027418_00720 [Mariniluteicoccus endophyticus]
MDISTTADFAADPTKVFEMLTDREFLVKVAEASGAVSHDVKVVDATTTSTRELPNPPEMQKFAGKTLTVVETINWGPASDDGSRTGTLDLKVPGQPVSMPGTVTLAPGGRGTTVTVQGDLSVKVPLLGKKIEKAAAPAILEGLEIEQRVGDQWLAEH